jgi:RNA polymerase sigma factor (sigma-70 family)
VETNYQQTDNFVDEESVTRRTRLFNQYVLPHKKLVYMLCIRYSYSQGDIEDNYNDVLVNFFKYIETYDTSKSIQTWLHIVTKRFVIDMNSRRSQYKRSDDLEIEDITDYIVDEENIPSNSMSMDNYSRLYSDDVLNALDSLKPIYKEALLLQQAGYKLSEIMEISFRSGSLKTRNIETVKSRLFLAKQQMRKLIDRDGERREE